MTTSRPSFPPLPYDDAVARATDADIPTILANPNVFRVLLHHPPIARIVADLVQAVVLDSVLDARLREMAIMRAAWLRASKYEWASHYGLSVRAGMADADVVAIRIGPDAPGLSGAERAVLAMVDEVLANGRAADATLAAARDAAGSDDAYLELLAIPGFYAGLATMLDALEVPLDEGVTAWPPDGISP